MTTPTAETQAIHDATEIIRRARGSNLRMGLISEVSLVRRLIPEIALALIQARIETQKAIIEAARCAYAAHIHEASVYGDQCAECGLDLRDGIHLRSGETGADRIMALHSVTA